MKNFSVDFCYTEGGRTILKAKTEQEALDKVYEYLEEHGLCELSYEALHREYFTQNALAMPVTE